MFSLNNLVQIFLSVAPILGFYLYWKFKNRLDAKHQIILFWGGISWIAFLIGGTHYFGVKEIDSPFERATYKAKYYVYLYPDSNSSKNYKLPAEINAYSIEDVGRVYELKRVFFPDGGKISFDFENPDEQSLKIGEKILLTDTTGEEWLVELSNQKVKD